MSVLKPVNPFVFYIENPHQTKNEKTKTQCKNKVNNNCDSHANMDHFTVRLNLHRNIISRALLEQKGEISIRYKVTNVFQVELSDVVLSLHQHREVIS